MAPHVHDGGVMASMDMGSMSMGAGIPTLVDFPKIYWGLVGATIGIATIANVINILICRQRLSAARNGFSTPARPKNAFMQAYATTTAIAREATHATLDPVRIWKTVVPIPQFGQVFLATSNVIVLTVLCFVGFGDTLALANLENVAYRIGFVCLAQIPLLFLLAGKNNLVGFFTGMSYEKLNWLHRWCARTLFLFATVHFGYWLRDWWPYGDYVSIQIKTNNLVYWGLTAWCFLAWIVFTSFRPIRRLSYEVFIIQHIITFSCFIGFTYKHLQPFKETHIYLWVCAGLFWFDRLTRALLMLYTNISYFHPEQRKSGKMNGFWAGKGDFTPLAGGYTKITLKHMPLSWKPGQHVFVSCHSVVPLQSHPFTIASLPQDGKIEFIIKAENGGTRRFLRHAERAASQVGHLDSHAKTIALEGPYGAMRPLRQFDSVVLLAGSTGATFAVPLLRDIVLGWKEGNAPGTFFRPGGVVTRHIRFVWVVKTRDQLEWFRAQLEEVTTSVADLQAMGRQVNVEISIYCTCDESFTEEYKGRGKPADHGKIEEVETSPLPSPDDAEKKPASLHESVHEVSSSNSEEDACGPNGTCCCTATIEDEDEAVQDRKPCCCGQTSKIEEPRVSTQSQTSSASSNKTLLHHSIAVFAGRPNPRNIIRKSLEQAHGESAVVVCGPTGLVVDVRKSTVALSDERAVHKGTGAQGVYLYCESFEY